tara:strand:- start:77 stop:574 length:498 start_codon:yes stop_codon:yes gene_type:complete
MIYTNNMAPRAWVLAVKRYLELKLGFSQGAGFFNRVISAYKVGGKQIEKKRTSHAKTYSDLLSSGNLSPNTQVLFFDDQNHPIMGHKNVKYVKVPRYTYIYNIRHMLAVFLHCPLLSSLIRDRRKFVNFMYGELKNYDINSHLVHHIPKNEGNELIKIIKNFANV